MLAAHAVASLGPARWARCRPPRARHTARRRSTWPRRSPSSSCSRPACRRATAVPAAALPARLGRRAGAQRRLAAAFGQRPVLEHRRADAQPRIVDKLDGPMAEPPRILIAGGYGVFGRLLARELLDTTAAHLVLAGRD